jgi:hypothetical protein
VVICVDYSGDDGFSADGSQVGHVPEGLGLHVRGPLLPGLVRPVAVYQARRPLPSDLHRKQHVAPHRELYLSPMMRIASRRRARDAVGAVV